MKEFRCRTTLPYVSEWTVQLMPDTSSPEEAANQYHLDKFSFIKNLTYKDRDNTGKLLQSIHFVIIEVFGFGEWISRIYEKKLIRKGGVKVTKYDLSLSDIAWCLRYEYEPQSLLEKWDYEEDWK